MQDAYTEIGHIVKPHGLRGMLKLRITEDLQAAPEKITHLFIQKNARSPLESYEVQRFQKMKPLYMLLTLKDITSYEVANEYRESKVFSLARDVSLSSSGLLTQYINYMVYVDEKPLARIHACYLLPKNPLFSCIYQDQELLIPAHKQFIVAVEQTQKKIHMTLPEGLLEL